MGYTDNGGGNLFTDDDGSIFEDHIDKLATAGVTKGCAPGLFCPDDFVTRGQMAAFLTRALGLSSMKPPPGFIGMFEGFDPPPDNSFVTWDIGPTGSDHKVKVVLFDDGGTICLNNFGEFSPVTLSGIGTRLDPTHIDITWTTAVCHTTSGNRDLPGVLSTVIEYDPVADVIRISGTCHWRSDGGSATDC